MRTLILPEQRVASQKSKPTSISRYNRESKVFSTNRVFYSNIYLFYLCELGSQHYGEIV